MAAAADAIVLDSSPDNPPSRSRQIPYSPGKIFGLAQFSSPASLDSPSMLFEPGARSRFFEVQTPKDDGTPSNGKKGNGKTTRKRKSDTPMSIGESKPKRTRKKLAEDSQPVLGDAEPTSRQPKDNAPKKTRKKRSDAGIKRGETKNKILTGRVSKANSNAQVKDADKKTAEPHSPKAATKESDDGLNLDEAPKRRLDWTPTKDTSKQVIDLESGNGGKGNSESACGRGFGNLLSEYNFSGTPCTRDNQQMSENAGLTKRRRIELVDSSVFPTTRHNTPGAVDNVSTEYNNKSDSVQPTKISKRQPKKATTLTARMTAQYASERLESNPSREGSTTDETNDAKPKRQGRGKAKAKDPEFIILSPEAAVKSMEEQDLIFGTCSQLQREDSPTMLKEMQTAIHESECLVASKPESYLNNGGVTKSSSSSVSRFRKPRNLWSVAARDTDGSLMEMEVLDMVNVSDVSQIPAKDDISKHSQDQEKQELSLLEAETAKREGNTLEESSRPSDESMKDSNPTVESSTPASAKDNPPQHQESSAPPAQPSMPQYTGFTDAELSKQIAAYGMKAVRNRKRKIELLQKCWESKYGKSTQSGVDDSQSTFSTQPQPAPKPVEPQPKTTRRTKRETEPTQKAEPKRTSRAPSVTVKTTDAPTSVGQDSLSSSRPSSSSNCKAVGTFNTPPKTRKIPLAFSFRDIEEIGDSEDEDLPSPSRIQDLYKDSITDAKPLSTSAFPTNQSRTAPKPEPQPQLQLQSYALGISSEPNIPDLASQITKAVRMQSKLSPIGGRKRPSWHEKILMYDPIILEDFTTWLNIEGLGLIEEDREVSAVFVREWCESKGICCCFLKPKKKEKS